MNKEKYLKELKNCIQALPVEEQNEALDYYRGYFEDAGDDGKVIDELGSPEKLAEEIKAKFACVPAKKEELFSKEGESPDGKADFDKKHKASDNRNENNMYFDMTAMRFSFEAEKVKNLDLQLGAAEIVMISGSCFSVETRGISRDGFRCELSSQGTLLIDSSRRLPSWSFFSHENPRFRHPRILLAVPENAKLDVFKLKLGAGSFKAQNVTVCCNVGCLDVSAGQLIMNNIRGGRIDLRCGMGDLKMNGEVHGITNIDCGMGSISMNLIGNPDNYSIDAKVGLGEVTLNNLKKSGLGDMLCTVRRENHFSVNCGMGSVAIKIQ